MNTSDLVPTGAHRTGLQRHVHSHGHAHGHAHTHTETKVSRQSSVISCLIKYVIQFLLDIVVVVAAVAQGIMLRFSNAPSAGTEAGGPHNIIVSPSKKEAQPL